MKILHLTTHLNRGGISRYLLSVGSRLQKRGHEIFVVSSGGEMEEEFKAERILLKTLPIRTKSELSPKIYLALPELIRWLREKRIDLLHAHTRVTQVLSHWIHALTGKPYVTTSHGFYKPRLGRRLLPGWGERVVAISEPVGDHLREIFRVPPHRIRVVHNGVDLEGFLRQYLQHNLLQAREEYGIPKAAKVVGITARLVPDKGHEYLIRAVKRLESEIPNLQLLIVGDGRYRASLERLVEALDLGPRVSFTGNLRDVSKPLAAMDLFVLPAVWREGFGLSIVEAMACQKPVIVTNIWALNTLIQDGVNGILVEPRSVEVLAEAIRRVIEDESFRKKIGEAAQRTAQERFSLDRMVQELEGIYEEVIRS